MTVLTASRTESNHQKVGPINVAFEKRWACVLTMRAARTKLLDDVKLPAAAAKAIRLYAAHASKPIGKTAERLLRRDARCACCAVAN